MWTTIAILAAALAAQAPLHDAQYPDADIAYGATLTRRSASPATARRATRSAASTCAAARSEMPSSIAISSASSAPGRRPACRRSRLDSAEMAGIIAYLRNMNAFDAAAVKTGDAARGTRHLRRQRRLRRAVTASARHGSRVGPNLSDIGAARSAGVPSALARRSEQPDDADQPSGPRRHERRHDHQRPAAQRRHLQRADHRRSASACIRCSSPTFASSRSRRRRRCRRTRGTLSDDEIADVLAYLLSLKGQ